MKIDEQQKLKIDQWIENIQSEEFLEILYKTIDRLFLEQELKEIVGGTSEYLQNKLVGKETFYVLDQLSKKGLIQVSPMVLENANAEEQNKVTLFEKEISIYPEIKDIAAMEILLDDSLYYLSTMLKNHKLKNQNKLSSSILQFIPSRNKKYKKMRYLAKLYERNPRHSLSKVAVAVKLIKTQGEYEYNQLAHKKLINLQKLFNRKFAKKINKKLSVRGDYLILK